MRQVCTYLLQYLKSCIDPPKRFPNISQFFSCKTRVDDEKFRHIIFLYEKQKFHTRPQDQTARHHTISSDHRNLKFRLFKSDTYCQKRVLFIMQQKKDQGGGGVRITKCENIPKKKTVCYIYDAISS